MHAEWCEVPEAAAAAIAAARARGGRVVAVGTTVLRTLESPCRRRRHRAGPAPATPACSSPPATASASSTCLLTNFHLPRSTLFMLVAAFAGLERIQAAYAHAVARALPLLQLRRRLPADPRRAGAMIGFELLAKDGAARRGRLTTAFGTVETPAFMPVGTAATVKAMTVDMLAATGAEIVLCNTYHLMLRPGAERVARLGGLHRFMRWDGPILTDSGGYQVMSLAERRKLTERGVVFSSHHDGSRHELTPERSVAIQHLLDATITMVLDECIALPAPQAEVERAMELSLRWAARSKAVFAPRPGHGLFGIVQGGTDPAMRARSASGLVEIGFDGYAIGGLAVGEPQELMFATLDATCPLLPRPARATSWASASPPTSWARSRGGSTCSTASCPPAPAAPPRPSPAAAPSTSRTPATPTILARWTRNRPAQRRATIPAPICTTWSARARSWVRSC